MKKAFFLLFAAVLILFACKKKVEGCLDADAQNFQVDADRSCDSCCAFPKLQLNFAFRSPFDSLRTDARGIPFRLRSLAFYVSEIELLRADGSAFLVQDSLRLRLFPDSTAQVLRRDFVLFKHSLKNFDVGSVVAKGDFEGLRFSVGLEDLANRAIPKLVPASSPLALQAEKMWASRDSGYLFFKLVLKKDTATAAAETAFVFEKTAGRTAVVLPFPSKKSFKRGQTAALTVILDVDRWLEGVDFSQPDALIFDKIRLNLASGFGVR